MTKRQQKRKAFLTSITAMILCITMLVGTTFSWFTDSASNTGNRVEAGVLDVQLLKYDEATNKYEDISGKTGSIFNSDIWEPGKTEVVFLQVKNNDSLAFNYNIVLNVENGNEDPANTAKLEEVMSYALLPNVTKEHYDSNSFSSWEDILQVRDVESDKMPVGEITAAPYGALKAGESDYFALAIHMDEEAGNAYQGAALDIDVNVVAKQMASEYDSFGNQYDADSLWTEQESGEKWIDVIEGVGDFEAESDRAYWTVVNDFQVEWRTDDAPSGDTYLYLGNDGSSGGRSRVKHIYDNLTTITLAQGVEYKLTGWVRQDGDAKPTIVSWDANMANEDNGPNGYVQIFMECAEKGVWEQFEITILPAKDCEFLLRLDNPTGNGAGGVAFDDVKLVYKVSEDPIDKLVKQWEDKLAAEAANSQMVVKDPADQDPYTWKDPLPGTTNLIQNGDFSIGKGTSIRKDGVNNPGNNTGWTALVTQYTGESDAEITDEGTLKITHNDIDTQRSTGGATMVVENIAGGAEYQISFKYKIDPRDDSFGNRGYGPSVSLYTYPDPSIPGAAGKLLEELALEPVNLPAGHELELKADGQWHVFHGRTFVSEQAWMVEVHMRAYLYPGDYIEYDDVEFYMVDVSSEIELDIDGKFYYTDKENAKFKATLAANLFPDLVDGSTVDFVVYDGQNKVWSSEKMSFDENYNVAVEFPLSNLLKLDSPYVVKATLYDKAGEVVCQASDDIFMYERPTAVDGQGNYTKFGDDFIYSVGYHSSTIGYPNYDYQEELDEIGVTVLDTAQARNVDRALAILDFAHAHGKKEAIALYYDMNPAGHPENIYRTIEIVSDERVRNHPAFIGYNIMDEPWLHGSEADVQKWLEESYRLIRQFDQESMIYFVECSPKNYYTDLKYADALLVDPYLPAEGAGVYNSVARAVDEADESKPIFALLETYKTDMGRILSGDEVRNNNWQALIAGAQGIGYYATADAGGIDSDGNYIPMWEMTSDRDEDTGAEMFASLKEWAQKEQELAFDHFVHGKTPDFNEVVAIADGYIYSSWVVDGEVYLVVLNVAGAEVTVNVPLTSADGSVSIGTYTASVVAGSEEATMTGNGAMSVTLAADKAILYKITPDAEVDFSGLE